MEEGAAWFQALGICNLLLDADPDRFYENLVRSGHARRYFLQKSRDEGNNDDYQLATSRWDSFLDVVASGHFQLARADYPLCPAIARVAPTKPFPEDIFPEMERECAQDGG